MKKNKPIIISDPFPRKLDLLFSKKNMKFINRTNREIHIYYDPLKHTSNQLSFKYVNAQLLLHHCKLMGKVSPKPENTQKKNQI